MLDGSEGDEAQEAAAGAILALAETVANRLIITESGGIGSNFSKGRQADYVLSPWSPDEEGLLPVIVDRATKAVIDFATQGLEKTMNLHNGQVS